MAVIIRLAKTGRKGEAKYRIVVKEKRSKRDGKAIEILGWYEKGVGFEKKKLNKKRFDYWVSCGAKPTPIVQKIAESK